MINCDIYLVRSLCGSNIVCGIRTPQWRRLQFATRLVANTHKKQENFIFVNRDSTRDLHNMFGFLLKSYIRLEYGKCCLTAHVTGLHQIACTDYSGNGTQVYNTSGSPLGLTIQEGVAYYTAKDPNT